MKIKHIEYELTFPNGTIKRYRHSKLHNINGPALTSPCGVEEHWINGKLHRIDGPAAINRVGNKKYFLFNQEYQEKDFFQEMFVATILWRNK